MKRPTFEPKPPAPSVHPILGPAIERSRKLTRDLRPDEAPASRTELVDDIARSVRLPDVVLRQMRDNAKRQDDE